MERENLRGILISLDVLFSASGDNAPMIIPMVDEVEIMKSSFLKLETL